MLVARCALLSETAEIDTVSVLSVSAKGVVCGVSPPPLPPQAASRMNEALSQVS
jgi:hypothetical protein